MFAGKEAQARDAQLKLEINRLRAEAKQVFSPATFAQSAKLERKANAIEKSLKQPDGSTKSGRLQGLGAAAKGVQVGSHCLLFCTLHDIQTLQLEKCFAKVC